MTSDVRFYHLVWLIDSVFKWIQCVGYERLTMQRVTFDRSIWSAAIRFNSVGFNGPGFEMGAKKLIVFSIWFNQQTVIVTEGARSSGLVLGAVSEQLGSATQWRSEQFSSGQKLLRNCSEWQLDTSKPEKWLINNWNNSISRDDQNAECGMRNAECGMRNAELGTGFYLSS